MARVEGVLLDLLMAVPISATLLAIAVAALVLAVLPRIRRQREVVFQEEPS